MGPWGGFITGLCENVEYVITPAVIVTFIAAYVNGIFGFDAGLFRRSSGSLGYVDLPGAQHLSAWRCPSG